MPSRTRIGSRRGHPQQVDLSLWPEVDIDALTEKRRDQFLRRRQAITMYLGGAADSDLRNAVGMGRDNIYRLIVGRCLKEHPDGLLMGWRGALPHFRVETYRRRSAPEIRPSGTGAVGVLKWLFESPGGADLEAQFHHEILGKRRKLASAKALKQEAYSWFLKELRKAGFEARGEWPFNVESMGYVSIYKYIQRVLDDNPKRQRQLLGGPDAERKAIAGDGAGRPVLKPFERVECDAHKIDARMVVQVPSPHGGLESRKIHRLWVIVIIEVASRSVLGYHLSLRRECSAEDVLRAIKNALTRWERKELQFSDNAYIEGAGFPSARHDKYIGACWDEFSVDGAMANVCARVERQLREVVGSAILKPQDPDSYTSRRSKDDRPFIETFFRRLASGGFHRLSSTTRTKPQDKRGADPDIAAQATQFQLEYAAELLDTLVANYNATPHSGVGSRSPIEQLDFLCRRQSDQIRQADAIEVRRLVGFRKQCTVLGGSNTGHRPYLNFANARYSSEWLCQRTDLIGKVLWLQIENENDARWAIVSTQDGLFLGAVRAAPPWHLTPHSVYIRSAIRALEKNRRLFLTTQCDAVEELIRYAESSEGRKLPTHPAYLEARRVLQLHAEGLSEQSMVSRARGSVSPRKATVPAADREARHQASPDAKAEVVTDKPALPKMHMAKTW